MKYILVILSFFFLIAQSCKSTATLATTAAPVLTVVSFNSICCGVRSDGFLKTFFESFKERQEANLQAFKVTGCGKEGEYKVIFHTKDLSSRNYKEFSTQLRSVVDEEANQNKSAQHGTLHIETMDSINVTYCRGGEVPF